MNSRAWWKTHLRTMADDPDIKSNVKFSAKGIDKVKADVGGLGADIATILAAMLAGGNKFLNLLGGIGAVITGRVLGPLGLVSGALFGVLSALKLVVQQSQLLAKGLEVIKNIEFLETQFKPLLQGAALAKERIKELFVFAATTPFQLPEIVEASRVLEVLTKGALATGKQLKMIGDAAAVAGRPLQETAFWVGRLYDALQSGSAIGEAMFRIQEMGLVSGETRRKVEELRDSGASFAQIWGIVERELKRADGGMKALSQTLGGLETTVSDTRDMMVAAFGEPFLEIEKDSLRNSIKLLEGFTPVLAHIAEMAAIPANAFSKMKASILQNDVAVKMMTMSLKALFNVLLAGAVVVFAVQLRVVLDAIIRVIGATKSMTAAVILDSAAKRANAAITEAAASKNILMSVSAKALRLSLLALRGVLGLVKTALVQAFAVIAANPITAVLGAAAVALTVYWKNTVKANEAILQQMRATDELVVGLREKIRAMETEEQRANALVEVNESLAKSYERLNEAKRQRDKEAIANIEYEIAALKQLENQANGASGLDSKDQEMSRIRERVAMEREIRDIIFQGELSRLTTEERALKLKAEQLRIEQEIATAQEERQRKERVSNEDRVANARINAAESLKGNSEERLEEIARELNKPRVKGQKRRDLIAERNRLREQVSLADESIASSRSILEGNNPNRTKEEQAQLDAIADALEENQRASAEIEQTLAAINKRRAEELEKASMQLAIQHKVNQAARLQLEGDIERADAQADEVRELENKLFLMDRVRQLRDEGIEQLEAEKRANEELQASEQQRLLSQREFIQQRMDEIAVNEALAKGDEQRARTLKDFQRFREIQRELVENGKSADQASALAIRQLGAEFGAGAQGQGPQVSADSYAKLGLGGNARGSDPLLAAAQRQERLLEQIAKNTSGQVDLGVN